MGFDFEPTNWDIETNDVRFRNFGNFMYCLVEFYKVELELTRTRVDDCFVVYTNEHQQFPVIKFYENDPDGTHDHYPFSLAKLNHNFGILLDTLEAHSEQSAKDFSSRFSQKYCGYECDLVNDRAYLVATFDECNRWSRDNHQYYWTIS